MTADDMDRCGLVLALRRKAKEMTVGGSFDGLEWRESTPESQMFDALADIIEAHPRPTVEEYTEWRESLKK